MDIPSDYEADMEANWAMIGLEKEVSKAKDRQRAREELLSFLETHPDLKRFYLLCKAVDKY